MSAARKSARRREIDRLYLVRHGRAEDQHLLGDDARALTRIGRRDFAELAAELADEMELEGIATSPLVRAVQTAELLAGACGIDDVIVRGELGLGASPTAITALARELGPGWALVGHNPTLSFALATLVGASTSDVDLRKGAVAALAPAGAVGWTLDFVVSPGHKRKREL